MSDGKPKIMQRSRINTASDSVRHRNIVVLPTQHNTTKEETEMSHVGLDLDKAKDWLNLIQ